MKFTNVSNVMNVEKKFAMSSTLRGTSQLLMEFSQKMCFTVINALCFLLLKII